MRKLIMLTLLLALPLAGMAQTMVGPGVINYSYDAAGNRTTRTEYKINVIGGTAESGDNSNNQMSYTAQSSISIDNMPSWLTDSNFRYLWSEGFLADNSVAESRRNGAAQELLLHKAAVLVVTHDTNQTQKQI